MSIELIDGGGTHPCRFQGVCTVCGWHWPKGGYVQVRSIESIFADHDCHPDAHVSAWCTQPAYSATAATMDQTVVDE